MDTKCIQRRELQMNCANNERVLTFFSSSLQKLSGPITVRVDGRKDGKRRRLSEMKFTKVLCVFKKMGSEQVEIWKLNDESIEKCGTRRTGERLKWEEANT